MTESPARGELALPITGVILAGGRATRWGGQDKGLIEVAGRPMVEHVIDALRSQVDPLIINANRNLDAYRSYGFPVVSDGDGDFLGPLAGIAAGLDAADTEWVMTVPCDAPLLSADFASRLAACLDSAGRAEAVVAHDGSRMQPMFALLRRDLAPDIRAYLRSGERGTERWYGTRRTQTADFSDHPERFLNINGPEDGARLEARLARRG